MNENQQSIPPELAVIATSLRMASGREWSRDDVLVALLHALDLEYRLLLAELRGETAAAPLAERVASISSYVHGKSVSVAEGEGYTGVTEGLDARGFLRVRTATGVRTVVSGGVRAL
jgi:BirA family biotin operon repressor/biotin-[acetyl-CoA-carboxylase] ligase